MMQASWRCECCGGITNWRDGSLIADWHEVGPEWFVACSRCSVDLVYWIDLTRLEGVHRHEGDDSVQGWLEHLRHKVWFTQSSRASFLAAVERAFKHAPRQQPPRKPRQPLSVKIRFAVLSRDGFRCRYCGRRAPDVVLHVDHVRSRKDGGTDDPSNLCAACADCNHGKGSRSEDAR